MKNPRGHVKQADLYLLMSEVSESSANLSGASFPHGKPHPPRRFAPFHRRRPESLPFVPLARTQLFSLLAAHECFRSQLINKQTHDRIYGARDFFLKRSPRFGCGHGYWVLVILALVFVKNQKMIRRARRAVNVGVFELWSFSRQHRGG